MYTTRYVNYTIGTFWGNTYKYVEGEKLTDIYSKLVGIIRPSYCCRYPCLSPKAEYNEEKVYSLGIAAARFLFNDRNVVTVGGIDAGLMLWDVIDD